jgi:hypothetical protein
MELHCRRTACRTTVDVTCVHKDTGEKYCVTCARKINRACNEIVVHFPFKEGDRVRYEQGGENLEAVVLGNNHMGAYRVRLPDGTETDTSYLWISPL